MGMIKAIRLEFINMLERKISLFIYLVSPLLILFVFYNSATKMVNWGQYSSLNIIVYDLYFPFIIPLIILFFSLQLTILRIVGERAPYGTLDRELIAISRTDMYLGKFIANAIYFIPQLFLICIGSFILLPVKNYGSIEMIIFIMFLTGLVGIMLGLLMSVFSKNKEQAVQLVPIVLLFLILLGGNLIPINYMPETIRVISSNLPFSLATISMQDLMLNGVGIEDVIFNIFKIMGWIVLLGVIGIIKFNLERKK